GREAVRPVLAGAADETRPLLVDHTADAVAVVLDLVEPAISAGWFASERRELRLVLGMGHSGPIVSRSGQSRTLRLVVPPQVHARVQLLHLIGVAIEGQ